MILPSIHRFIHCNACYSLPTHPNPGAGRGRHRSSAPPNPTQPPEGHRLGVPGIELLFWLEEDVTSSLAPPGPGRTAPARTGGRSGKIQVPGLEGLPRHPGRREFRPPSPKARRTRPPLFTLHSGNTPLHQEEQHQAPKPPLGGGGPRGRGASGGSSDLRAPPLAPPAGGVPSGAGRWGRRGAPRGWRPGRGCTRSPGRWRRCARALRGVRVAPERLGAGARPGPDLTRAPAVRLHRVRGAGPVRRPDGGARLRGGLHAGVRHDAGDRVLAATGDSVDQSEGRGGGGVGAAGAERPPPRARSPLRLVFVRREPGAVRRREVPRPRGADAGRLTCLRSRPPPGGRGTPAAGTSRCCRWSSGAGSCSSGASSPS